MASISTPFLMGGPYSIEQGYGPSSLPGEPAAHGVAHFHEGIDLGAPAGTGIIAAVAGWLENLSGGGFGNYQILHSSSQPGTEYIFGHESKQLAPSGPVAAGTEIGLVGSTGYSTGPHLHFQVNQGAPGQGQGGHDVNPTPFLGGQGGGTLPSIPNPTDALGAALGGLGTAIGAGFQGAGNAIGAGITGSVTSTGHGLTNAITSSLHNVEVFASTQAVALFVAAIVVLVVFMS